MIYLLIFRLWLDNCYTNSLWIKNKSFLLYSELAYILHTESNDQKNHYDLNWRGKRGLNFNKDIWTYRNFGADHFFFFFWLMSLEHIIFPKYIRFYPSITEPTTKNLGLKLFCWVGLDHQKHTKRTKKKS